MMAENMQNGCVRLREGDEGRGLFPVLQPSGSAYAEVHPVGDSWLQSLWKEGKQQYMLLFSRLLPWCILSCPACDQSLCGRVAVPHGK